MRAIANSRLAVMCHGLSPSSDNQPSCQAKLSITMELQLHLSTLGTFHLVSKVQLNVGPQVRILQIRDSQTESGMATGVISKQQITCNFHEVLFDEVTGPRWQTREAGFKVLGCIRGYWQVPLSTFPASRSNRQGTLGLGVLNAQKLALTLFSSESDKQVKVRNRDTERCHMPHTFKTVFRLLATL